MTAVVQGTFLPYISNVHDEDQNLLLFFNKFTYDCPEASEYLNSLAQYPFQQKVSLIRQWLKSHEGLLSRFSILNLGCSGLTAAPYEIRHFTTLQVLNLSDNPNIGLAALHSLRHLREINLSNNNLTELPKFFDEFKLKKINLRANKLQIFPSFVEHLDVAHLEGNPFGLELGSGKICDGKKTNVKDECLRLCFFTPLVHSVAMLINISYRIVRLVTLSHFWAPLVRGDSHYSLVTQVKEVGKDLIRVIGAPILLIALQTIALYGYYSNSYRGVILYGKLEKAIYEREVTGNRAVDHIALATLCVAYNALIIYCTLKYDRYI